MWRSALSILSIAATLFVAAQASAQAAPKAPPPPSEGGAAPWVLTLDEALALARRSSPAALVGASRISEAKAGAVEAKIFPRYNPTLELELGPRIVGEEAKSVVVAVGLSQNVDLGGGVAARQKRVSARVAGARAEADGALQQVQRDIALAFLRGIWADARLALAAEGEAIGKGVVEGTKRRVEAGDATLLQLNVAKGGFARAGAERRAAEATREAAYGELRALLGLSATAPVTLVGKLEDPRPVDMAALRRVAGHRPDVLAMAADLDAARADLDLAGALAAPQLAFGARYELEDENIHTVLGTLTFTLPIFDHAQGLKAQAQASAARAKAEMAARAARATTEVETAATIAGRRADAAAAFDGDAGGGSFAENVKLAMKGYLGGETSLADVLLVRRELVETEQSRIDRLLEARSSEIELLHTAGALR